MPSRPHTLIVGTPDTPVKDADVSNCVDDFFERHTHHRFKPRARAKVLSPAYGRVSSESDVQLDRQPFPIVSTSGPSTLN